MKTKNKLENVLKTFYGIHRQTVKPRDAFDQQVLNDAMKCQSKPAQSRCRTDVDQPCTTCRSRWLAWTAAAVVIVAVGVTLMDRPNQTPPEKPHPTMASSAVSDDYLTMFNVSMVLRTQGIEAALAELNRPESEQDQPAPMTTLEMLRMGLAFNGNH